MKEDLLGGLKNAVEKGYSLEQAAQSFINAGYNPSDVQESCQLLTGGVTSIINPKPKEQIIPLQKTPNLSYQANQNELSRPKNQSLPVSNPLSNPLIKPSNQLQQTPQISSFSQENSSGINIPSAPPVSKNRGLIIILIISLAAIASALLFIFLFKDKLTSLFS